MPDKKTEQPVVDLKLTDAQIQEHLENLVFKFSTEYSFELFDKTSVKISNLNNSNQLTVEDEMQAIKGSHEFTVHKYQIKILSHTLKSYGEEKFDTPEAALEFITKLPSSVLDIIISYQNTFEKVIHDAAKDKHFKNLS